MDDVLADFEIVVVDGTLAFRFGQVWYLLELVVVVDIALHGLYLVTLQVYT